MASPSDPVTETKTLPLNPTPLEEQTNINKPLNQESTEASIEESWNEGEEEDEMETVSSPIHRRSTKRKKPNQKKRKLEKKCKEKLEVLSRTLNPVAFVPGKTLDFTKHEKLLKTLGLWEFLHLPFDQNIRKDLITELIAYYSPESRCSYVKDSRININRADLTRALKLPKVKDIVVNEEVDREVLDSDESVKFIDEVVANWVLLQGDNMWIMPGEVVEWGKDIKLKRLEKLDWPAVFWFMVEKELKAEPPLGDCFFASHLQLLIKTQKEDLLKEEEEEEEDDVKEVEVLVESTKEECLEVKEEVKEEEDVGAAASGKDDGVTNSKEEEDKIELNLGKENVSEMVSEEERKLELNLGKENVSEMVSEEERKLELNLGQESVSEMVSEEAQKLELNLRQDIVSGMVSEEAQKLELNLGQEIVSGMVSEEEDKIELNLGQEIVSEMESEEEQCPVEGQLMDVEEQLMDVEENKNEEDERWEWNDDVNAGSHFLRPCNLSSARERDEENKIEEPMEIGEEETEEDEETREGGFTLFPNGDSLDGVGHENLMLEDTSPLGYGSSLQIHGNSTGGDFLASRVDMHMGMGSGSTSLFGNGNNKREIDHENEMYHSHNPSSKRLRTEEPSWDDKPPQVEMCIEQIEYWTEKARLSFAEKEQDRNHSLMNQHYLMRELEHKAEMIQQLERTKFEELQRKDSTIYRLESELHMMVSVLDGYRKALKDSKKASRKHRKLCPLRVDKPVYKDVKGSGGLVLSITEIERLRIRQEAEDKITRASIERQIKEFESDWFKVFDGHVKAVELLDERLIKVENEVKIEKETLSETKNHEASQVVAAAATEET